MQDLFRRQAVLHAARRLSGDVVLVSPPSTVAISALLCGFLVTCLIFAASITYSRRETVAGWTRPAGGVIRVVARQSGVVRQIHATEDTLVSANQALATLRNSADFDDGNAASRLIEQLGSEGAADAARAEAQIAKLNSEAMRLKTRRAALRRELVITQRRIALQTEQVEIARRETRRAEAVASKGFLTQRELEDRRGKLLAAEDVLAELRLDALASEREITDLAARQDAIPTEVRILKAERAGRDAVLSQRQIEARASTTFVATAPIRGRVAALPIEEGQFVAAGGTVAILAPESAKLQVELFIPSRAVGFIQPGQPVRLMYQAFPYQKFGVGQGVIERISSTVLGPQEVAIPQLGLREPVFRARVNITKSYVLAYGRRIPLRPGMLLAADIEVDRRTLIEWLFDPLYIVGRRL